MPGTFIGTLELDGSPAHLPCVLPARFPPDSLLSAPGSCFLSGSNQEGRGGVGIALALACDLLSCTNIMSPWEHNICIYSFIWRVIFFCPLLPSPSFLMPSGRIFFFFFYSRRSLLQHVSGGLVNQLMVVRAQILLPGHVTAATHHKPSRQSRGLHSFFPFIFFQGHQ